MFLLDTEHISVIQRKSQPAFGALAARMGIHPPAAFFSSVVSFHEQSLGAHAYINRAANPTSILRGYELFANLLRTYALMQVLPFDLAASNQFDALWTQGVQIGAYDLRIAATALVRRLTVLTSNVKDFRKVPGLTVEDWSV